MAKYTYIPSGALKTRFSELKKKVSYRIWQNRLKKYTSFNQESKILDIGCGVGDWLSCLQKWFPKTTLYGIDSEVAHIDYIKQKLSSIKLQCHNGQNIPFNSDTFDLISAVQVVEHLTDPLGFITETHRALKPNGLFLLTPNPAGLSARLLKQKWMGYREDHISLKTPDVWKELLKSNSFIILTEGTTGLSGFKMLRTLPFGILNWLPLWIFGYFPWFLGESYVVLARKK